MSHSNSISVSSFALTHNLKQLRKAAPQSKVMAVIKANAYGHGLAFAAKHLEPISDALAVASIDEGIQLRQLGVTKPIVLLEGVTFPSELLEAARYNLTLTIHAEHQVVMLERYQGAHVFTCWIKVDVGLHRLGFFPDQVATVYRKLSKLTCYQHIGFLSQPSRAKEVTCQQTQHEKEIFLNATEALPGARSFANSACVLGWPDTHLDWIRPGIALYGVSPISLENAHRYKLMPVMTVKTQLISIRTMPPNVPIGYKGTWRTPRNGALIGILGLGYGDGYPCYAPTGTPVLIHQNRAPIVGQISMDKIAIDLQSVPYAKIGDSVTLIGAGLPVETLSKMLNVVPHALLSAFGIRASMRYEIPEPLVADQAFSASS